MTVPITMEIKRGESRMVVYRQERTYKSPIPLSFFRLQYYIGYEITGTALSSKREVQIGLL